MDNAFTRGAGDARGGGGRVHRLGRLDPARDRNAEYVYGNASRFCALIRSVVTSAVPDLAEALKDQVKHVRRAAADALGKILSRCQD